MDFSVARAVKERFIFTSWFQLLALLGESLNHARRVVYSFFLLLLFFFLSVSVFLFALNLHQILELVLI